MGGGGEGTAAGKCGNYTPRQPLATVLHRAVSDGLPVFLAQSEAHGGVPRFVTRALHRYLACGDLSRGFVRVRCAACAVELKVAFSCKERSVCPSCGARRAALAAAHLTDSVLPRVGYRQWTLAFPRSLRVALALDAKLLGQVLGGFVRAVFALQRRRARALGLERPLVGAVAFVQNFTSALLLHPHFHVLFPEGVFDGGAHHADFAALPPPDDAAVERLLRRVARHTLKLARARFPDGLPYAQDAWDLQLNASAQTRLPLGEGPCPRRRRCAFFEGFSLHADTWVHQNDRDSLERLCRYGARGPLTLDRLSRREDGTLEYRLKKPAPNGATVLVLTALQLVKRLCALVVKPKVHLTRFFGVFAPNSRWRRYVVPTPPAPPPQATVPPLGLPLELAPRSPSPPRLDWAGLLRRVFELDVLACPCGGRRRVLAVITSPDVARKILGLPPRTLRVPHPPSTGPPQLALL